MTRYANSGGIKLPLTGEKVIIRKLYKKDVEELYTLESDKEVKRYVGGPVAKPREEWVEGMRQLIGNRQAVLPFSIIHQGTNEFAGRTSLILKDFDAKCWEIQILIAKKYWGDRLGREVCKLLMTAAYDSLGAHSIMAVIDPNNAASRALVEAFGFINVGTNPRSERWNDGHYVYKHEPALVRHGGGAVNPQEISMIRYRRPD
jgi:[ribosomal protein S5]-alanine N-acetyltransferase